MKNQAKWMKTQAKWMKNQAKWMPQQSLEKKDFFLSVSYLTNYTTKHIPLFL
jgi:signal-transduction protein with cAMP-binding, CBS, and nucleotidyltransferase domain